MASPRPCISARSRAAASSSSPRSSSPRRRPTRSPPASSTAWSARSRRSCGRRSPGSTSRRSTSKWLSAAASRGISPSTTWSCCARACAKSVRALNSDRPRLRPCSARRFAHSVSSASTARRRPASAQNLQKQGGTMAEVRFEHATRVYPGSDEPAVDSLDLAIKDGEFMVLVGPSGSGKTTALRMLAGLEEVDAGAVVIGGRDVTFVPPKDRDVAMLRVQMRVDIADLQARLATTTVYVTHDQAEAMTLGHRVAVLKDARLQQCGPPRVLYERPANVFVAGFIGSPAMNLCSVPFGSNGSVSFGGVPVPVPSSVGGDSLVVGLRPESLEVAADGIPARVEVVEDVGADAFVFCAAEMDGESTRLVARTEARKAPQQGARVALWPRADEAHLFDPVSGERLNGR